MGSDLETRIRHVTAVLGPTNTGKTHLAIERMLGHESGMIGLPLRLLAREVYDKIAARVGVDKVGLITGEEKIKPERARYWVCTVEAMPRQVDVDFLAIDEIQLAADPERGHVFTDRLLHARGRQETFVLGAQTMRDCIADLIPGANFISRPRLSKLTYAGEKKITRLPARSAVVTFSAGEVYAIAELIRRQRGGAAVVLGALSPRTRNAQVALYQSGDVDFIVATDAVGMGLNLDVDHVAFAAVRKFDGQTHRNLTPGELGQIAGRAGRHMNDGSFGVTAGVDPFEHDLVERLETHTFDSIKVLQWRNRSLDLRTLEGLRESLREVPREQRLTRARMADDVLALETLSGDREIAALATSPAAVAKLWDVCQVPDYRKISSQNHAEMVSNLYKFLMTGDERIPEDWFAKQVAFADRVDGDIDTLANRIAHIRTWTFVSNRSAWLADPEHWQGRARAIEDALSDALHEQLTQRFVDRRTSALMRGMRDKEELKAEIADDGAITVEGHFVGRLKGFRFYPETQAEGIHGKATRGAAAHVVGKELGMRTRRVASAKPDAFKLTRQGRVLWREDEIAEVEATDDPLKPVVRLLADEHMAASDKEKVQARLDTWLAELVTERLKPMVEIARAEDVSGLARGIAFRLTETYGALKRETVAEEIKSLDQTARSQLRKYGVRFGAFNIFFPLLLKPAAAELRLTLWAMKAAAAEGFDPKSLPEPPRPGLTSVATDPTVPEAFYRVCGYHVCGPRAVRLDILERLADLIRPLLAFRANPESPAKPPKGATGDGGFTVTQEMMSILGCSPDELGKVLKELGFRLERRPVKVPPRPRVFAETGASDAVSAALALAVAAAGGSPAGPPAVVPALSASDVPDAGAEGAPSESGAVAAPEEVFEDVWRPRRRGGEPRRGGEARHGRRDGAPAGEGEGRGRPEGERRDRGWRGSKDRGRRPGDQGAGDRGPGVRAPGDRVPGERGPADRTPAVAAGPDARVAESSVPSAPGGTENPRPQRSEDGQGRPRDRDGRRQGEGDRNRPPHQGKREGDRAGRPGGGDRGGDRGDRGGEQRGRGGPQRGREDRSQMVRSSGPSRSGTVDPDSPFAALGALKQALEKRSSEPKT